MAEGLSSSDLGIIAAKAALADAGLAPGSIDLVITATISPDRIMPATAARIAYECGCGNAGAFDLSAGCTGFVYALAMAAGAVASGLHDHVLVVGAEAISRILDWEDRSTAVLFGDGAGAAVVLGARQRGRPRGSAGRHPGLRPGRRRLGRGVPARSPPAGPGCPPRAPRWRPASTT